MTTSLKLKVVRKTSLKLKVLPRFPSSVIGGTAIGITKSAGSYLFDLDYDAVQITPTVSAGDMPNSYNLIWNQQTKTYAKVPFALQVSGISSLAGQTGAITIDSTLQMVGSQLSVGDHVSTIDGKKNAITLDGSLKTISNALAVNTVNLSGGVSSVVYTQSETSAVSSPLITRLHNTLFASDFGAVGDDSTNDYAAIQAFLTAVAASGKEGRFDPGKFYYVSNASSLTLGQADGVGNTALYGFGSQIRTDPTKGVAGLIVNRTGPVTRADETRKILIDGLRISQFQNANAVAGFYVFGSPFVTLRDCTVSCGSDNATSPLASYAAYYFLPAVFNDPNTGSFWCTIDTCAVKGATTATPFGIRVDGQCNAMHIRDTTISNATTSILFSRSGTGANVNEAGLANGVRITGCDFEGFTDAIGTAGTASWSTLPGLIVTGCRAESGTNFFNYGGNVTINPSDAGYPILHSNYLSSSVTNYYSNPNSLPIQCADGPWLQTTPTPTPQGGSMTATATVRYRVQGKTVHINGRVNISSISGTPTGYISVPLPLGTPAYDGAFSASEGTVLGVNGFGSIYASTTSVRLRYSSTSWFAAGAEINFSGSYELA